MSEIKASDGDRNEPEIALASALRLLFGGLDVSLTRYSARIHRDKGAVSRYFSGERTPPWNFIHDLLVEVTLRNGGATPTGEVVEHFRRLHREALESRDSPINRMRLLQDKLATADAEATRAAYRVRKLEDELASAEREIAKLKIGLLELDAPRNTAAAGEDPSISAHVDDERMALVEQIEYLRGELDRANERRVAAEAKCAQLERQLERMAEAPDPTAAPLRIVPSTASASRSTAGAAQPPPRLAIVLRLLDKEDGELDQEHDAIAAVIDGGPEDEAKCIALRLMGLRQRLRGNPTAAELLLTQSAKLGDKLGLALRAAQARSSLVVVLTDMGRTAAAYKEAGAAETALGRLGEIGILDLARLWVNLAMLHQRTDNNSQALELYSAAEPVLVARGEAKWEILLCTMRGMVHARRGAYSAAADDLARARDLANEHGYRSQAQAATHNLGYVASEMGDYPRALSELSRAHEMALELGKPRYTILSTRAETLLAVGLWEEARENAKQAADNLELLRLPLDAAEARLTEARAALECAEPAAALELAQTAKGMFTKQRRPGWSARAEQVALAARFAAGERTAKLLNAARKNAKQNAEAGRLLESQQSTLLAARTAVDLGRTQLALLLYEQVAEHRLSRSAHLRLLGWQAKAELAVHEGDHGQASRAVTRGLAVVAEYAGMLGATDLRSAAAGLGTDLAALGVRLALSGGVDDRTRSSGSATNLLIRADQWRANTLRLRPVRPPEGGQFASLLSALRAVNARFEAASAEGGDLNALQLERVRLEQEITELARHTPGTRADPGRPLDLRHLREALGDRALVEYLHFEGQLIAISLVDGRARRYDLGPYATVVTELDHLRSAMSRVARVHGTEAMQRGANDVYEYCRRKLDMLLLDPLIRTVRGRAMVIVPTESLYALPWSALPSLEGESCTVAPSARFWMAGAPPRRVGGVLLAHGPALPQAEAELEKLSALYPDANILMGNRATVDAVLQGLDGARLAHLVTHGRFRADNPLFSNFELADGPLTMYDFEQLDRCPEVLVLSACDSALSGVRPGDELMGLAGVFLALGAHAVITSVASVHAEACTALMVAFHRCLSAGVEPAEALAQANTEVPHAPGFICLSTRRF